MATKTINISMDEALIKKIDKAAKAQYSSRSDYLRMAVIDKLDNPQKSDIQDEYRKFVAKYGQTLKNLANR